jgi:quercetin dioxygenase-like cupin family protein
MKVIQKDLMPVVRIDGEIAAHIFDGVQHGVGSSAFIVDLPPGPGPRRHSHPYDEIFVVVCGAVRLEAGGETCELTPDEVGVAPAGVPHTFTAIGPERARLVNVHASDRVHTIFDEECGQSHSYDYYRTS